MKTYKIYTLGCKVNQYDSGKLAAELKQTGLSSTDKNADFAIINSCAVTKTAMIKSGRMIKLARKENPEAKIALAGCWPKLGEVEENMAGVDLVDRTDDFKKLIELIFKFQIPISNKIKNPNDKNNKIIIDNERARYFIKIQDGCEQFCSYCIIPYTRGKLRSRPVEEIVSEIKQAVETGYGEIVLSGIHLGLYQATVKKNLDSRRRGNDKNNLTGLLKKIIEINGLGRVRLSSIEITEVTDELINLMKKSKKICRHLHIPLQSGNDKILKLMSRPYDAEYFKDKIKRLRRVMPAMAITTDVITGFPGETEKDFKVTEKFIGQIEFSRLHVFPFSAHEKTPAAKMPYRVEEKTKARRADELRKLNLKLMKNYKKKFKGMKLKIAVEQISQDKIIGKTEYYFDIEADKRSLKNKNIKIGEILKIMV